MSCGIPYDRTILGGVALNSTAVYVATSDAPGCVVAKKREVLFEVTLPGNSIVPAVTTDTMVFVPRWSVNRSECSGGETVWFEEAKENNVGIRGGAPISFLMMCSLCCGNLVESWLTKQTGRILWERQVAVSRGRSPLDRIVDSKAHLRSNGFIATATQMAR